MDNDSSSHMTEVAVEAPGWHSAVTDPVALVERAVTAALQTTSAAIPGEPEVSVLLTDDGTVRDLNRTWRDQDKATNVLSFPAWAPGAPGHGHGPVPLGDIAVALETVLREAASEGKTPGDHLAHLIVHGTLHLLGHDHEVEPEAERMEALEVKALARLGIADPYQVEVSA